MPMKKTHLETVTALYAQLEREEAAKAEAARSFPRMLHRIGAATPAGDVGHPAYHYVIGLGSGQSRLGTLSSLHTVARLLGEQDIKSTPWHRVGYHEMHVLRSMLAERYAPTTANKILSMVCGVLGEARTLGMMSSEDYRRAVAVPRIPVIGLSGRVLAPREVRALFQACAEPGPRAARDAALLAVLLGGGLRRAEAVRLDLEHLDTAEGTLRVIGKDNREHLVRISSGVATAIAQWLTARGDRPGPLLCSIPKAGRPSLRRLSTESIRQIVIARATQAGIGCCTPRDLRRTFVASLLDHGNDISVS